MPSAAFALTLNTYSHGWPEVSRAAAARMARLLWQNPADEGRQRDVT